MLCINTQYFAYFILIFSPLVLFYFISVLVMFISFVRICCLWLVFLSFFLHPTLFSTLICLRANIAFLLYKKKNYYDILYKKKIGESKMM